MATAYSTLTLPLDDSGDGKVINRYFDGLHAKTQPEAAAPYVAVNQVDTLPEDVTFDGGNYTITVTLNSGETFTTASIIYTANAATIETAIDSAATTASITGWTNGDITVSGGNLATADIVLTYDGASVAGLRHSVAVANDVDLTTGTLGVFTITTIGHPVCPTIQMVATMGFLSVPTVDDPTTWTWNTLVPKPEKSVWEFVARAAADELQDPSVITTVLTLGGFVKPSQPRSSIVS